MDHNGKDVEGKLVAVQEAVRAAASQTSPKDYRLTVLVKEGSLHTMWMGDVRSVEFVDL